MHQTEQTVYEQAGGDPTFALLVDAFYRGVEGDPLLRPMYPADDMDGARERLFLFLTQFFGGPPRYEAMRGHPRLRMRHFPFRIGPAERDAWLAHMRAAVEEVGIEEPARGILLTYFDQVAHFLVNQE
ncbi:MAG: globin [Armatimonadota bacterium]